MATPNEKNVIIPMESAESLKSNLRQVAEELTRVRDRTREEAESLDRIRGMLDLKYLNDLLSVIDQLEKRVKEVESGAEQKKYILELEAEQRRLAKLWDAFKTQEDQLKAVEREREGDEGTGRDAVHGRAGGGTPVGAVRGSAAAVHVSQGVRSDAGAEGTRHGGVEEVPARSALHPAIAARHRRVARCVGRRELGRRLLRWPDAL